MKSYFDGDSYNTPPNTKRAFLDHFFGRWYFYLRYLITIFKYRPLAIRDEYDDATWADSSIKMHRVVENCGGKINIEGMDNLRAESEPVVFVGNHMSTAESQLLPGIIEPIKRVTFVVKESLTTARIWGPIMRARRPIVVGRVDPRKDMAEVLSKGVELLAQGRSVFIFPQATRNIRFIPEEFNSLGIKLAKKAKVKVLPVALKTDFWGNGKIAKAFGPIRRKNHIHFHFGKALDITGNGKEQHQEIIRFIEGKLASWGHLAKV